MKALMKSFFVYNQNKMPPKKSFKTNELTNADKIKLINDWDTGRFNKRELTIKWKVNPQTVTNILDRRERIVRTDE